MKVRQAEVQQDHVEVGRNREFLNVIFVSLFVDGDVYGQNRDPT